jgi:hypothetical protein
MNVLTYVGAGLDTSILKAEVNDVGVFLFVDSLPRSPNGEPENEEQDKNSYKTSTFVKDLKKELKKVGYVKVRRYVLKKVKKGTDYYNPGVVIFRSKNYKKFLYYFYSTSYPCENDVLKDFLKASNYLYVANHTPRANIIDEMYETVSFIGTNKTCLKNSLLDGIREKVKQWYELDTMHKLKKVDCEFFFRE